MARKSLPPLESFDRWMRRQGYSPSLLALKIRHQNVADAVRLRREAKMPVPHLWLVELGTDPRMWGRLPG